MSVPAGPGSLGPHRVLSFAFQNPAGLSPGLTKAFGLARPAAPDGAAVPGSTRGGRIPYGDPLSSLFLARAPGAVPCPEQRAAASQQPRAGSPRARPGARSLPPLQGVTGGRGSCRSGGVRGLLPAQRSAAAIGTLGSTGAAQAHPGTGFSPATVLSAGSLHRLRTEPHALIQSLKGPARPGGHEQTPRWCLLRESPATPELPSASP